jgi:hypothetical protein
MTSIFSAISGQFGRAIIIGALLPAAVFVLVMHLFVAPMLPWDWRLITRIAVLDAQWQVAALVVAATLIAGLLYAMNTSITRFYEGYPWENGWLGRWCAQRYRAKLLRQMRVRQVARKLGRRLRRTRARDRRLGELAKVRDDADREIHAGYPSARSVLPTRLGNVIRAFETYPRDQYGISAIPLWPRFVARIRADHAAAIDDAKTTFDVAIHLSFLAAVTAFSMIAIAAVYPLPLASTRLLIWFFVRLGIAMALIWAFYELAIDRAAAWGDLVRGVFDLYRWEVLKDLGYETRPGDLESERALWTAISVQMIFGDGELGPTLRYDSRTLVLPVSQWLSLTRSIRAQDGSRRIAVVVENRGADAIANVRIIEHLPAGSDYVDRSARLDGNAPVEVRGTNPYSFTVGGLAPWAKSELTYEVSASATDA